MQSNRSRDTKAELAVRRLLHAGGLRYRVDFAPVPGLRRRADIVFTGPKVAVFIDGCFWHGCPDHGSTRFGTNADYWQAKIEENRRRDIETTTRFEAAGWRVMRFWSHVSPDIAAASIEATVKGSGNAYPRRGMTT